MCTREITKHISADAVAQRFLMEARSCLTDQQFEIYFVGSELPPIKGLPANCHCLEVPGVGYYGWKSAGASVAKGRYIVFWDSDCRPHPGYLKRAIDTLEGNPALSGLTGASKYDGSSFLTRLNTVLNFGYLHREREHLGRYVPQGHNIVIRRDLFPPRPFDPYRARDCGAPHLAKFAQAMGKPLKHDSGLIIYHEDLSYSLRAMLEKHLPDMYIKLLDHTKASRAKKLWISGRTVLLIPLKRMGRILRDGKNLGFGWFNVIRSIPVVAAYALLDCSVFLVMACIPRLFDRWVQYQFGDLPHSSRTSP